MMTLSRTRKLAWTCFAAVAWMLPPQAVAAVAETTASRRLQDLMAEGKTETDLGHADAALRAFTAVVDDAETPPALRAEALVRLGAARRASGDRDGALRAFQEAAKAPGANSETQALLVRALGSPLPGSQRWAEIWSRVTFAEDHSGPNGPSLQVVWPDVPHTTHVYRGRPISLRFKDSDLLDFFRMVADVSSLNVVVFPGVHGRMSIDVTDVPWDRCLDQILAANGYAYQWEDNVVWVSPAQKLLPQRRYTGRRIDVDWGSGRGAASASAERDLKEGLAELAAAGGVGLEIDSAVEGRVTLRLSQVRWDHAFDIVTRVNGLEWTREGSTLKVFPLRPR